jgi:hypothetical protein
MQKRKHSDDFDVFILNMFEEHLPFHLLNYFMLTSDGYKRIRELGCEHCALSFCSLRIPHKMAPHVSVSNDKLSDVVR